MVYSVFIRASKAIAFGPLSFGASAASITTKESAYPGQRPYELDPSGACAQYPDPRRDEWATKILPKLKVMPLRELMDRTRLTRSTLQAIRAGRRPHVRNREIRCLATRERSR